MASTNFDIFKMSDREILDAFRAIAKHAGVDVENAGGHLMEGMQSSTFPLKAGEADANTQAVLKANAALFTYLSVNLPAANGTASVSVKRGSGHDTATVSLNNNQFDATSAKILAGAHKYLRAYQRTESTDKLLGDELAEFYHKREESLLKLEGVSQELIRQSTDYRHQLDKEAASLRTKLQADAEARASVLEEEFKVKEANLTERNESLDKRTRELDDRSSKHARRQIHKDLKGEIAQRNKAFVLSERTVKKRIPIHILFVLIILLLAGVTAR
ncbi:MAG: hypothetical protein H0V54_03080 [Chthoniobacterales bacterium]|nr:hypothetical protein [Chthoniobacterales bacterium]